MLHVNRRANFLLVASLMLGCGAAPTAPDPNNGVSDTSYRQAIGQAQVDFKQLGAALTDLKLKDATRGSQALFPGSFWDAEILLAKRGEALCAATLQGNATAPSPAPSVSPAPAMPSVPK